MEAVLGGNKIRKLPICVCQFVCRPGLTFIIIWFIFKLVCLAEQAMAQFQHAGLDEGIFTHPSRWKNRIFYGSPGFYCIKFWECFFRLLTIRNRTITASFGTNGKTFNNGFSSFRDSTHARPAIAF
jgi:hypothetical protein